jgi:methyl-accepting chemotaxis protein
MFKRMKLKAKLILIFLAVGLLPLLTASGISIFNSEKALTASSFNQLSGVRDIKKKQIENFFAERQGDMGVLMETVGTLRTEAIAKLNAVQRNKKIAIQALAEQWRMDIISQQDRSIATKGLEHYRNYLETKSETPEFTTFNSIISQFIKTTGYYDYFVIDLDGRVVQTHAREADYGTNLVNGPYKDSGLAEAFRLPKTARLQRWISSPMPLRVMNRQLFLPLPS